MMFRMTPLRGTLNCPKVSPSREWYGGVRFLNLSRCLQSVRILAARITRIVLVPQTRANGEKIVRRAYAELSILLSSRLPNYPKLSGMTRL